MQGAFDRHVPYVREGNSADAEVTIKSALGMNWYLNNFVRLQLNAIDWTIVSPDAKGVVVNDHGQSVVGRAQIAF